MKLTTVQEYYNLVRNCPLFVSGYVTVKTKDYFFTQDVLPHHVPPQGKVKSATLLLEDGTDITFSKKGTHVSRYVDSTYLIAYEDQYQIWDTATPFFYHTWKRDEVVQDEKLHQEINNRGYYSVLDELHNTLKDILTYEHMETNKTAL
ncbi:hypothetical protein RPZ55_001921 [Salmonella enterica]|nr:hypothetical protein [Salmonella enterica]ECO0115430.1 hypothetical protein [Salmonella enterica subsp. enterica serovar Schwarzengrund]EDH8075451.1 hypothetical protein [Salmonella enterica subsp. enterica serovar Saintpaul]EBN3078286.1 hypothetical protein [Salmonella enterica]EDF9497051.1 hypothetical protein [Salmonella enterica]